MKVLLNFFLLLSIEILSPYSPSAAGFIRNQLLARWLGQGYWPLRYHGDRITQHISTGYAEEKQRLNTFNGNQHASWSRPDFLRPQRGDAFCPHKCFILFFWNVFISVKVYEALRSSAVVVYIMLTTMYLIPIWVYSGINVTRLAHFLETR